MKKFNDFINENSEWERGFMDAANSWAKILNIKQPEWLYEDNVRSHWISIIEDINNISEKDYKNYEKIKIHLNRVIDDHNDTYKTIVMEFENKGSRYQFCAEHLNAIYPTIIEFEKL
jgi:hypothetical protein